MERKTKCSPDGMLPVALNNFIISDNKSSSPLLTPCPEWMCLDQWSLVRPLFRHCDTLTRTILYCNDFTKNHSRFVIIRPQSGRIVWLPQNCSLLLWNREDLKFTETFRLVSQYKKNLAILCSAWAMVPQCRIWRTDVAQIGAMPPKWCPLMHWSAGLVP
jgi:hypothetical protein